MPKKAFSPNGENQNKLNDTGIYKTHALADAKTVDPANKVSKPSDKNVAEARNWVNLNEK